MEIKFRAWDGKALQYGGFSIHATGKVEPLLGLSNVTDESPIMLYTGLKDKNGKEIYEGDILECKFYPMWYERISWRGKPDAICKVYWDYCGFGLKIFGKEDTRYSSINLILDEINSERDLVARMNNSHSLIIGNIYQNPELIKSYEGEAK